MKLDIDLRLTTILYNYKIILIKKTNNNNTIPIIDNLSYRKANITNAYILTLNGSLLFAPIDHDELFNCIQKANLTLDQFEDLLKDIKLFIQIQTL